MLSYTALRLALSLSRSRLIAALATANSRGEHATVFETLDAFEAMI